MHLRPPTPLHRSDVAARPVPTRRLAPPSRCVARADAREGERPPKGPPDFQPGHRGGEAPAPQQLAALALDAVQDTPLSAASNTVTSLWASYAHNVARRPYRTKALTSLTGFMIGDVLAQRIEGGGAFSALRMLRQGAYGLCLDGPVGHAWYQVLDRRVEPDNPQGLKAVLLKTAADQLIWAPIMTMVYFAFLRTVEGHPELIQQTIQDKLLPTVIANYVVWPLAHFINFRYVPTQHRILYNNVVAVFWNAFLSTLSHTPSIDASGVVEGLASAADQLSAATDALATQVDIAVNANPEGGLPLHVVAQRVLSQIPEPLHVYVEQFRASITLSLHEQAEQFAAALRAIDPKQVPVAPTRSYFHFFSTIGNFCRQVITGGSS